MSFWTDTHAHIYTEEFDPDRPDVIERSQAAGVNQIFMPNIDHTSIDRMLEAELRYPGICVPMMGLHPCSVKKDFEKELYQVEQWLAAREFAAVGEIGTDLYWDKTFWNHQQEAFVVQVSWAKKFGLPVVLHTRQSIDETIQLLEPMLDSNLRGIFHCFSGTPEQALKIIGMGFYLGFGGVTTFKNGGLERVLEVIGLDHVVLETDSPYLAPMPYRGKRNEPSYIPLIGQRIAALKKMAPGEVQSITTGNAQKLFGKTQ